MNAIEKQLPSKNGIGRHEVHRELLLSPSLPDLEQARLHNRIYHLLRDRLLPTLHQEFRLIASSKVPWYREEMAT
jgi:hypothetical protein